jgi:hypothetical protein
VLQCLFPSQSDDTFVSCWLDVLDCARLSFLFAFCFFVVAELPVAWELYCRGFQSKHIAHVPILLPMVVSMSVKVNPWMR